MKTLQQIILASCLAFMPLVGHAQEHRWTLEEDGPITYMNLKDIHAFDSCFDIEVKRLDNGKLEVLII